MKLPRISSVKRKAECILKGRPGIFYGGGWVGGGIDGNLFLVSTGSYKKPMANK